MRLGFLDEGEQVHLALQIMSYAMGDGLETAAIHRSATHDHDRREFPMIELDIANDFATRPTVTQMFIMIKPKRKFRGSGLGGPF
jgi:hypothetical protein